MTGPPRGEGKSSATVGLNLPPNTARDVPEPAAVGEVRHGGGALDGRADLVSGVSTVTHLLIVSFYLRRSQQVNRSSISFLSLS